MSSFYVELSRSNPHHAQDHSGSWWQHDKPFATFNDPLDFMDYVREHRGELQGVVAFSGSASTGEGCNGFIQDELRKVVV